MSEKVSSKTLKCPECGKEFSEYKGNCQNCGFPLSVIPKILEARKKGVTSSPYKPLVTEQKKEKKQP